MAKILIKKIIEKVFQLFYIRTFSNIDQIKATPMLTYGTIIWITTKRQINKTQALRKKFLWRVKECLMINHSGNNHLKTKQVDTNIFRDWRIRIQQRYPWEIRNPETTNRKNKYYFRQLCAKVVPTYTYLC